MVAALTTAELGVATAEAAPIVWHWAGTVTGHTSARTGPTLDTVVPLGTRVDVMVSLDPAAADLNPAICLQGMARELSGAGADVYERRIRLGRRDGLWAWHVCPLPQSR